MKIRPVEAELFHADTRTDMMKLVLAFAILRTCQKRRFEYTPTNFRRLMDRKKVDQGSNSSDIFQSWPS